MTSQRKWELGLCVIIFLFMPYLFILWSGISIWQETLASVNWPSVDGRVIVSEIRVREKGRRRSRIKEEVDYPFVSYIFVINGKEYTSNEIHVYDNFEGYTISREKVNLYHKGKQVKVYYNPKNPSSAVLEPGGEPMDAVFWHIFIGTFGPIGAMMIFMMFVREPRTSDDKAAIETNPP